MDYVKRPHISGSLLSHMFQCVFMTCCLFMCVESERGLTQFSFVPEKALVNSRTKLQHKIPDIIITVTGSLFTYIIHIKVSLVIS